MTDIKSQTAEELQAQLQTWGQPAYRASQVLEWIYDRSAADWDAMTNLPKGLRDQLRSHYTLRSLELVRRQGSGDATQKFLWRLEDHSLIESVLIPANPALFGEPSDRHTLCVSTQVGCAYGCKFCASGLAGWKRNLRVEEIVDQVLAVERWNEAQVRSLQTQEHSDSRFVAVEGCRLDQARQATPHKGESAGFRSGGVRSPTKHRLISNLVIMGMGEPLANYEQLLNGLRILHAPWGRGIGARKITISTSGLAPQIRLLAAEPLPFRLAVSLHGATDETRNKIMPVNRKYPLRELVSACEYYQKHKGHVLTLEYILIAGVNDDLAESKPLAALSRRLDAKVNLIPYNRVQGLPWERPSETAQKAFLAALERQNVSVTLRREKGHDIDAACGQLRLQTERELAGSR